MEAVQVGEGRFHAGIGDGEFGESDRGDDQFALKGRQLKAVPPSLPTGFFPVQEDQDRAVEGGAHGGGCSRLSGRRQFDRSPQLVQDLWDVQPGPRVRGIGSKLLPGFGRNGLGGFQKWGGFIEFQDVARLEVKTVADVDGDGDLALEPV